MTTLVTFGNASALKMVWAAMVVVGGPLPSGALSWEASAQWFDGAVVKGQGRLDGGWQGHRGAPIYTGERGGCMRCKDSSSSISKSWFESALVGIRFG
jgi:hypothetical protein